MTEALYVAQSGNRKTGDIPQQFIGATRQDSLESCGGCPLLEQVCFAQNGTEAWAHGQIIRALARGKDYSLAQALEYRDKDAAYVRFGAIGDPSALEPAQYFADEHACREAGLGVISYTHFWKSSGPRSRGRHLKGHAMASCDTWQEAQTAVNRGWRATVHVKRLHALQGKTTQGARFTLCPAQRTHNRIQCNDCGLCDATKRAAEIIVFFQI